MYLATILVLLVLEAALLLERWVYETLALLRGSRPPAGSKSAIGQTEATGRAGPFVTSDAAILLGVLLLAGLGTAVLSWG